MREDSRRVQRVINALGRRNAVEACGPANGLIALGCSIVTPKTVGPKSRNGLQSIDN